MSALASEHTLQPLPVEATRLLYERHSGRIFGYCLSLLGSREEAEDAMQTTFMNAQRGLDRGVVPEFELAWLFKIARNVCHNRHASASRRRRVESVSDLDALQDVLATPERGASVSIAELTAALGSIPERQRRALLLREFQGFSYDEIAAELGVSVAAVETLIFRARRAVAEHLEQKEATGLRGMLASILALLGRLFEGGAGTLKLAAVTAGLATTATLATVPGASDHRAPAAPLIATAVPHAGGVSRGIERDRVRPTSRPVVNQAKPSKPAPPLVRPPVRSDAAAPSTEAPAQSAPREVKAASPNVNVPEISVPTVAAPAVTVPDVSLPIVELPSLDLPVDTPSLPDLPKLP